MLKLMLVLALSQLPKEEQQAQFCAHLSDGRVVRRPCSAGGGSVAAPSNVLFVTSTLYPSNIGGLAGADAICAGHAADAGLSGTFVALLTTTTSFVTNRLPDAGGWMRVDGLPVAANKDQLISDRIWYQPALDEHGALPAATSTGSVMSGSFLDGGGVSTCGDYTNNTGNVRVGLWTQGGKFWWGEGNTSTCTASNALRLYCAQIDRTQTPAAPARTSRLLFESDTLAAANTGIAGLDTICADEAADAGLSGTFVAFATVDATHPPSSRIDAGGGGGNWSRVDGVAPVALPTDILSDGRWRAGIVLNSHGIPVDTTTTSSHWNGAPKVNDAGVDCTDWSSNSAGVTGTVGNGFSINSGVVATGVFGGLTATCNNTRHVACIQQ